MVILWKSFGNTFSQKLFPMQNCKTNSESDGQNEITINRRPVGVPTVTTTYASLIKPERNIHGEVSNLVVMTTNHSWLPKILFQHCLFRRHSLPAWPTVPGALYVIWYFNIVMWWKRHYIEPTSSVISVPQPGDGTRAVEVCYNFFSFLF